MIVLNFFVSHSVKILTFALKILVIGVKKNLEFFSFHFMLFFFLIEESFALYTFSDSVIRNN